MFRRQILAQLKKDFPGVPEKVLGLIADKLSPKVTAEDQIQGVIDELDNSPISIQDYADFLQREGDRRVTEATRKNPGQPKPGETKAGEEGDDKEPKSDIDKLTELINGLATTVNGLITEKNTKTNQEKLAELLPDVPAVFYKGRVPAKSEDLDSAVEDIKADWEASGLSAGSTTTTTQTKGLKNLSKPPVSGVVTNTDEKKVDPAIKDFFEKEKASKPAVTN